MDQNVDNLFGGPLGAVTFTVTLQWNRPTWAFLARFRERLAGAAAEHVDQAMTWILIAYVWKVPGYTADWIVRSCRGNESVARQAADGIAGLFDSDDDPDHSALERGVALWDALLDANPAQIPTNALRGAGRWALVKGLGDDDWLPRADRSMTRTEGSTDYVMEVADRCKLIGPSERVLRVLRQMQGRGEPWERGYVAEAAMEVLKNPRWRGLGLEFNRLRKRLLDLGHVAVREIEPDSRG